MNQSTVATYLPPWKGANHTRRAGPDEDAVTIAVQVGRAALNGRAADRVVVVTRQPALVEGGSAAPLVAGLGLPADTAVVEQLGGAPGSLDACSTAAPGTLVIGVDLDPAGGGALLVGPAGPPVRLEARLQRSLPIRTRDGNGVVHEDHDDRLVRERGTRASLAAAALPGQPAALAGASRRDAAAFCAGAPPALPTTGASSPFFALAALADRREATLVGAVEQAALVAVTLDPATVTVVRDEPPLLDEPMRRSTPGPEMKVALAAYDRAFEPKLRWQAGRCTACATLALPPRHRCLTCGTEGSWELVALPRTGEVYTATTVHVPVPGLATPYTVAVVQLDGVDVRALVSVTDAPPGSADIGDHGRLVFRRVAVRSGVPDYGYGFSPEVR